MDAELSGTTEAGCWVTCNITSAGARNTSESFQVIMQITPGLLCNSEDGLRLPYKLNVGL